MAEGTCRAPDCTRRPYCKGLCQRHYDTWRHHGRLALLERPTPEERFWAKVARRGNVECWPWTASTNQHGYGKFYLNGRLISAPRASYFFANGHLPPVVRHSCDNPLCVNPAHLLAGTQLDNIADMHERGRHRHYKKLSDDDVREIRRRFDAGESRKSIAVDFSVTAATLWPIVTRKTWKHVQ